MTDPFDQLAAPIEPRRPRTTFALDLRARLIEALDPDLDLDLGGSAGRRHAIPNDLPLINPKGAATMASTSTSTSTPASAIAGAGRPYTDGIWSVVAYADPDAGIRFVTDVLGFTEQVLVRDDSGRIVHSEYRWPEGGIVQIAGTDPDNPFAPEPGQKGGLYVITRRPDEVWARCRDAGVEVLRPPEEPHYDPGGMGFAIRDPEGNIWSFGSYAGGSTG